MNKYLRTLALPALAAVLSLAALPSCIKEELAPVSLVEPGGAVVPEEHGLCFVTADFGDFAWEGETPTKSSVLNASGLETKVSNVTLVAYDASSHLKAAGGYYTAGFSAMALDLFKGKTYNIYAVANMGDMTGSFPQNETNLANFVYEVGSFTGTGGVNSVGIPMSGQISGYNASAAGSGGTVSLKRLFAKVEVTITCNVPGAVVNEVRVFNLNGVLHPFGDSYAYSASDMLGFQDYQTVSSPSSSVSSLVLYVPENMQGTVSGIASSSQKAGDKNASVNAIKERLSYMEVTVGNDGSGDYTGSVVYRSYLGNNATTNFDVKGNRRYTWSLTYNEDGLGEDDWKHDLDGLGGTRDVLSLGPKPIIYVKRATYSGFDILKQTQSFSMGTWSNVGDEVSILTRTGVGQASQASYYRYTSLLPITSVTSGNTNIFTANLNGSAGTYTMWLRGANTAGDATLTVVCNGETLTGTVRNVGTGNYYIYQLVTTNASPKNASQTILARGALQYQTNGTGSWTTASGVTYSWQRISGPTYITPNTTSGGQVTFSCGDLAGGTAVWRVTAQYTDLTDNVVKTLSEDLSIVFTPANYTYQLIVTGDDQCLVSSAGDYVYAYLRAYLDTFINGVKKSRTEVTSSCTWARTSGVGNGSMSYNAYRVYSLSTGTGTFTATYHNSADGADYSGSHSVTFFTGTITYTFEVSPGSVVKKPGETARIYAYLNRYANGTYIDRDNVSSECTWTLSNVTPSGTDIAVSNGNVTCTYNNTSATVNATYTGSVTVSGSTSGSANVQFTNGPYYTLYITSVPDPAQARLGQTIQLTAWRQHHNADGSLDGSPEDVTSSCTWSPTSGNIKVSNSGSTKGLVSCTLSSLSSDITATITAKYGSGSSQLTADKDVTYTDHTRALVITPAAVTLVEHHLKPLTDFTIDYQLDGAHSAYLTPSQVSWSSSNTSVIAFDGGKMKALATGTSEVRATYFVDGKTVLSNVVTVTVTADPNKLEVNGSLTGPVPVSIFVGGNTSTLAIRIYRNGSWTTLTTVAAPLTVEETSDPNGAFTVSGRVITSSASSTGTGTVRVTYDFGYNDANYEYAPYIDVDVTVKVSGIVVTPMDNHFLHSEFGSTNAHALSGSVSHTGLAFSSLSVSSNNPDFVPTLVSSGGVTYISGYWRTANTSTTTVKTATVTVSHSSGASDSMVVYQEKKPSIGPGGEGGGDNVDPDY